MFLLNPELFVGPDTERRGWQRDWSDKWDERFSYDLKVTLFFKGEATTEPELVIAGISSRESRRELWRECGGRGKFPP